MRSLTVGLQQRAIAVGCGICTLFFALPMPIAAAQKGPFFSFPLQVGSQWIYENEWKSGEPNQPEITRWTTEETISANIETPQGVVVLRQVRQQGRSPDGYITARERFPYLIYGSCVYLLDRSAWDNARLFLRPDFLHELSAGKTSPELCFPIRMGSQWGTIVVPWRVQGMGDMTGSFLPPGYADAFHIVSNHFGSGGRMDVWFENGVGIVAEHYLHHGTYDEYTKRLRSFRVGTRP